MRSVNRGPLPKENGARCIDFSHYRHAKIPLVDRIGEYCSYCERPGDLHVEHVVPKAVAPALEKEWTNLLLGRVNCNSRKSSRNQSRQGYLWPDGDNTFMAFEYGSGGMVSVSGCLDHQEKSKAMALFDLVGLGEKGSKTDRRDMKRRQAWNTAIEVRCRVGDENTRCLAVKVALGTGFFSVWMAVFRDDEDMCKRLIEAFPGTRTQNHQNA